MSIDDLQCKYGGKFALHTESGSVYLIDCTKGTLTRKYAETELRRDGDPVTIFQILECEIGRPFQVLLEPLSGEGTASTTLRVTSPVTHILPM